MKGKTFFSFDLRSATDRVPAEMCASLIETLWGGAVAASWRSLLYREFKVPKSMKVIPKVTEVVFRDTTWFPIVLGYLHVATPPPGATGSIPCGSQSPMVLQLCHLG